MWARTLKRFTHYHDHWAGQSASSRLEAEQVETIKAKIAALEDSSTRVRDFTWLMQVLPCLCPPTHLPSAPNSCLLLPSDGSEVAIL